MDQELCLPDSHAPTICRFDNPNFWRIKSWGPLIGCGPSPTSSKISCMHGVLLCATTTKQLSSIFTTSVFSFNLLTIDKLWLDYFKKKIFVNVQFYQVSGLPFFFVMFAYQRGGFFSMTTTFLSSSLFIVGWY